MLEFPREAAGEADAVVGDLIWAHDVDLVVAGPNVVDEWPVALKFGGVHGEGDGHGEEEVTRLGGVGGELEDGH